jgi:hypothetical protein
MCAALGGSRGNRQSEQFGGLSAALELTCPGPPGRDDAIESGE